MVSVGWWKRGWELYQYLLVNFVVYAILSVSEDAVVLVVFGEVPEDAVVSVVFVTPEGGSGSPHQ
jgi:hypothetical protein